MYVELFGLKKQPFTMTPDPSFLYLTRPHRESLAGLQYAILNRKGFVVLTGDAGTGKTTLLNRLLQFIPADRALFSVIFNPTLTPSEFLELVLMDFGIPEIPDSKAKRLMTLHRLLLENHSAGKTTVLIIDEAHKLPADVLEEVRLLSNFELAQEKLLQIVLAGQSELADVLNRSELRQLKQRVAVRLSILPLTPADVRQYIACRWEKAGATQPPPFQDEAFGKIALYAHGIPRLINAICDNALTLAYAERADSISPKHILEVAADLDLLSKERPPQQALQPAVSNGVAAWNGSGQTAPLVSLPSLERYAAAAAQRPRGRRWFKRLLWPIAGMVI